MPYLHWLTAAASLALAFVTAAEGTTDAHRRRVLEEREETFQKWRDTIEKWKESSRR